MLFDFSLGSHIMLGRFVVEHLVLLALGLFRSLRFHHRNIFIPVTSMQGADFLVYGLYIYLEIPSGRVYRNTLCLGKILLQLLFPQLSEFLNFIV